MGVLNKTITFLLLFGCSQDTYFVSTSVVQDISQSCVNLPPEIDRKWKRLEDRYEKIRINHNSIIHKIRIDHNSIIHKQRRDKKKTEAQSEWLIQYYNDFEKVYSDVNSFLKNKERVFIDCLGKNRFYFITEIIYLREQVIRWVEKVNTLSFEISKITERIEKNHTYISIHILNELEVLGERVKEIGRKDDQFAKEYQKIKDYSERIKHLKERISLLREQSEIELKVLRILEGYK